MEVGIILLTLCAYALAIFLWVRERTPNYEDGMLGAHLASLLSPYWQALYSFSYDDRLRELYHISGIVGLQALLPAQTYALPRVVFVGAWVGLLPALAVFYLFRHRWWFPGYLTSLLTFVLFVVYHLLVETIATRQGWLRYSGAAAMPFGVPQPVLSALMNGLVSLGALAALLLTRRYSLTSLLTIVLPIPLALSLLVHGLLGAPLYTALILQAQSWAGAIGLVGTIGLLASGAHIIAGSLERPSEWRQTI
jgi:hypothetical protein